MNEKTQRNSFWVIDISLSAPYFFSMFPLCRPYVDKKEWKKRKERGKDGDKDEKKQNKENKKEQEKKKRQCTEDTSSHRPDLQKAYWIKTKEIKIKKKRRKKNNMTSRILGTAQTTRIPHCLLEGPATYPSATCLPLSPLCSAADPSQERSECLWSELKT